MAPRQGSGQPAPDLAGTCAGASQRKPATPAAAKRRSRPPTSRRAPRRPPDRPAGAEGSRAGGASRGSGPPAAACSRTSRDGRRQGAAGAARSSTRSIYSRGPPPSPVRPAPPASPRCRRRFQHRMRRVRVADMVQVAGAARGEDRRQQHGIEAERGHAFQRRIPGRQRADEQRMQQVQPWRRRQRRRRGQPGLGRRFLARPVGPAAPCAAGPSWPAIGRVSPPSIFCPVVPPSDPPKPISGATRRRRIGGRRRRSPMREACRGHTPWPA